MQPGCTYATPERPASDVVADAAAALTLASMYWRKTVPSVADDLQAKAIQLLDYSMEHDETAVASNFFVRSPFLQCFWLFFLSVNP